MKPTTTEEENEYLNREYVLVLNNEHAWYDATREAVDCRSYENFAVVSYRFLHPLMKKNRDSNSRSIAGHFIERLMSRVTLELWDQAGCPGRDKHYYEQTKAVAHLRNPKLSTPAELASTPESTIMSANASTPFQTVNYVYGQDVKNLDTSALISSLKRVEKEIADLSGVTTESKKITRMIEDLTSMKVRIVEALDAS